MLIQVVTFHLRDLSKADYDKMCEPLAPIIAAQPGLISKTWLENAETNTYGGVYTWRDRQSMEAFMQTDMIKAIASHPSFVGLASQDFEVDEKFSRVTRGLAAVTA